MKIVIDEKDFDEIIGREFVKYEYEHKFMRGNETLNDFKETKRWRMMKSFQSSLSSIKDQLKAS